MASELVITSLTYDGGDYSSGIGATCSSLPPVIQVTGNNGTLEGTGRLTIDKQINGHLYHTVANQSDDTGVLNFLEITGQLCNGLSMGVVASDSYLTINSIGWSNDGTTVDSALSNPPVTGQVTEDTYLDTASEITLFWMKLDSAVSSDYRYFVVLFSFRIKLYGNVFSSSTNPQTSSAIFRFYGHAYIPEETE